ncbi:hypothetical protein KM043_013886 [Ampulex compressa]|nr:hypothetical protein KM043_013886 [Ampulex compressa]
MLDPTDVIKMIEELQSGAESYRRSGGVSLRLSGTNYAPGVLGERNVCSVSPKRLRLDQSSSSNSSRNDGVPGSPWEWRRMKGEIVSLRTRLSHQEAAVQQLHQIRRQMEEIFEKEKSLLELQVQQDKQTIKQLELRLDVARRNIQETREAQATAEKELSQLKSTMEQKPLPTPTVEETKSEDIKKHPQLEHTASLIIPPEISLKMEAAESRAEQLEERLRKQQDTQQHFEMRTAEVQSLKVKINRLESERALWEEGMLLANRAARASDLEKELGHARETIATLKESVRGKLLLEEQMASMTKRLEHVERTEQQLATVEAKCSELQRRLLEYESVGVIGGPQALKRELNRLQLSEAVLRLEEGQLRSKLDAALREVQAISKNYEEAKKLAQEAASGKEKLGKLVSRLQKKMMLVTRERDSYRQQLDLYEKEMTVDVSGVHSDRVPALERAIDAYRELVAKLEADLQSSDSSHQCEECNKLREQVEWLKAELEHRALKGDFNCDARILHFKANPAEIAFNLAEEKRMALLKELEDLRAIAKPGECGPNTPSLLSQEMAELKRSHEIKTARLKEAFKASSQEYRQACYQLFGWRVDRNKEGCYKLSSMYAESQEDFLFFHVAEEGVDLLETAFSTTLGNLVERHLRGQRSVPMFLNAVQGELFAQQTTSGAIG